MLWSKGKEITLKAMRALRISVLAWCELKIKYNYIFVDQI